MRRDRKAPALYELMRPRDPNGSIADPGPAFIPSPVIPESDDRFSWLSPGRVLRIPVGYVIVAVLLVISLAVTGYIIGYKSREREARVQEEQALRRQYDGVTDPLAAPALPVPVASRPETPVRSPATNPANTRATPSVNPSAQGSRTGSETTVARPGRVNVVRQPSEDPRQVGLNYLVVAQLAPDEAEKAANFLAAKGLEIVVVSVDNRSSTWHVVVLQGFGAGEWYGPGGKRLESALQALGREYKRDHKGPVDFSDAWWQKFK